jgi:hypothetical protein
LLAVYAGGILEPAGGARAGTTVGGPAVDTEGVGEEDLAGPGLPSPEFVP